MNRFRKFIDIGYLIILISTYNMQAGEIHDAAVAGDLNKVRALIEADSTLLESKDGDGNTPLISACFAPPSFIPKSAVANFLIDKGANINARNYSGASPLYFAIRDYDLVERLIGKGADVNVRAYGDLTPLHQTAAHTTNLKVTRLLIEHGADLNARSIDGTALHWAIKNKGKSEMVKLLIESGAKFQKSSSGNTELHLAALSGYTDLVRTLVKLGADVNAVNDSNHTALYYAAKYGYRGVADVLIAAGANKNAIVETNFGKAPQLIETLRQGEAYLWYLGGSTPGTGYAIKTKEHLLIFDPSGIGESSEAGLANGLLNPNELVDQKITVLLTRTTSRFGSGVSELAKKLPDANFVLSFKPAADSAERSNIPPYRLAIPNESFSEGSIQVHTIPAIKVPEMYRIYPGGEGLGYLVEVDGLKIFHAGLHASRNEASQVDKYRKEIDFLKPFGPIDFVILPIKGRHLDIAYEPYLYLLDQLSPKAVYLIGDELATDEHQKCIEVLRARNTPVAFPEGIGERFHFLYPQEFPVLKGDYLGQTPPGDIPIVFARGIISGDYQEHGVPSFSPDGNEVFWQTNRQDSANKWLIFGKTMKRVGGTWTAPEISPYGSASVFSPDGKQLYFDDKDSLYFVEKQGNTWSEQKYIDLIARFPELKFAYNISVARNGTLYFLGNAEGQGLWKNYGIYWTKLINGVYAKPELLPPAINTPGMLNWTPFIAPDESYMIFCSRRMTPQDDYGDLYICFRQPDGKWTDKINLGEPINTNTTERFPTVSPDGKYLFFTRWTPDHDEDVFWVSSKIIDRLREKNNIKVNTR